MSSHADFERGQMSEGAFVLHSAITHKKENMKDKKGREVFEYATYDSLYAEKG